MRDTRRGWICLATIAGVLGLVLVAPPAQAATPLCADRDPLPSSLADELVRRYPTQRFSVAVVDGSTGCSYYLHPERRMTTASVLKTQVMAGVLLRAQREGRTLTQWERDRIWPMITQSANTETSQLIAYLGGAPALEALDVEFGLVDTVHPTTEPWGLTTTSVDDQARLIRQVMVTGGPLSPASRAEARGFLTSVVPSQRWGASAGVPPGWVVGQKNGFAPSRCCRWRLNTAGWVERPDGTGWSIVILSDGWPTEAAGIAAVDELGGRINRVMADPAWGAPSIGAAAPGLGIAARSPAGSLWTAPAPAGPPVPWVDDGGSLTSGPDLAASPTHLVGDAVVRGLDAGVWISWSGGGGRTWAPLGGVCTSGPSVARSGADRLDVFCRGQDGGLWSRWHSSATGWSSWYALGGASTSAPDAAGRPDGSPPQVVARGLDGAVWQYLWSDGAWRYVSLGGVCTSAPTIASSGPDRADVFCRGLDDQLWSRWWTPTTRWGPWHRIGGLLRGDVDAAVAGGSTVPDVVGLGNDLRLWRYRWSGSTWMLQPVT